MPFYWSAVEEETKEEKIEPWRHYLMMYYKPLISLILAVLFIFFVLRPMVKKRVAPAPEEKVPLIQSAPQPADLAEMAQEKGEEKIQEKVPAAPLTFKDQTLQIAQGDPSKAAMIVKTWLQEKE